MKVQASTIDELIAGSGRHSQAIAALDELFMATGPALQRRLFSGPGITFSGCSMPVSDGFRPEDDCRRGMERHTL